MNFGDALNIMEYGGKVKSDLTGNTYEFDSNTGGLIANDKAVDIDFVTIKEMQSTWTEIK